MHGVWLKLYMPQVEAFDQRVVAFLVVDCSINGGARKKCFQACFGRTWCSGGGDRAAVVVASPVDGSSVRKPCAAARRWHVHGSFPSPARRGGRNLQAGAVEEVFMGAHVGDEDSHGIGASRQRDVNEAEVEERVREGGGSRGRR